MVLTFPSIPYIPHWVQPILWSADLYRSMSKCTYIVLITSIALFQRFVSLKGISSLNYSAINKNYSVAECLTLVFEMLNYSTLTQANPRNLFPCYLWSKFIDPFRLWSAEEQAQSRPQRKVKVDSQSSIDSEAMKPVRTIWFRWLSHICKQVGACLVLSGDLLLSGYSPPQQLGFAPASLATYNDI